MGNIQETTKWSIGQQETSAAGFQHIQGVFGFLNARSAASMQKQFAINAEPARDPHSLIKYCTDEHKRDPGTEILIHGEIPNFSRKISSDIIDEAMLEPSYDAAMEYVEVRDKLYSIANQKKLSNYFQQKFDVAHRGNFVKEAFQIPPTPLHHQKCLAFIGPTGIGKKHNTPLYTLKDLYMYATKKTGEDSTKIQTE